MDGPNTSTNFLCQAMFTNAKQRASCTEIINDIGNFIQNDKNIKKVQRLPKKIEKAYELLLFFNILIFILIVFICFLIFKHTF